jgi:hypothetical protein
MSNIFAYLYLGITFIASSQLAFAYLHPRSSMLNFKMNCFDNI